MNNAGVAGGGRIDVAGMDEWQWITEINLFGVVRGTRTFVPMFKQQRSGHIVNIASLAGLVHPAGMGSYNAVKAGVVAFSETCAHELAEYGVRCSVVCPSYFRTSLIENMQALAPPGGDTAVGQVIGSLVADAPLGPEEIAAAVLEGLDRGEELILPDDAARAAYQLKLSDRAAYDQLMRKQAARLNAMGSEPADATSRTVTEVSEHRRRLRRARGGQLRRRGGPRVAGGAGHPARRGRRGAAVRWRCLQPHLLAARRHPRPDPAAASERPEGQGRARHGPGVPHPGRPRRRVPAGARDGRAVRGRVGDRLRVLRDAARRRDHPAPRLPAGGLPRRGAGPRAVHQRARRADRPAPDRRRRDPARRR